VHLGGRIEQAAQADAGATTRQNECSAPSSLACSTLLTKDQASPRLPKKLPTPVRTGLGSTSL
jgi:hypothetical protein